MSVCLCERVKVSERERERWTRSDSSRTCHSKNQNNAKADLYYYQHRENRIAKILSTYINLYQRDLHR